MPPVNPSIGQLGLAVLGYSFLSDSQRDGGTDVMLVLGVFVALTAFYRSPWGRPLRFVIDKLFVEPRAERMRADITAVVGPLIDSAKAAAKAQHDEQNNAIEQLGISLHARIDHLDERVGQGFDQIDQRLDKGADRLAAHDVRLAVIEARNPSTRSRKDDQ